MLSDNELRLAAFFDPRFKLQLITKDESCMAEKLLTEEFFRKQDSVNDVSASSSTYQQDSDEDSSPTKRRKKNYLASILNKPSDVEENEVAKFLREPVGTLKQLNSFPIISAIFKYDFTLVHVSK